VERPWGEREIAIERVVPGGAGLARVDGRVALVEGGLPGDRVRVDLTERRGGLLEGAVAEVVEAGPARRAVRDVCPHALDRSCGGCDWPAVRPESARELKTALVLDALRRIGKLSAGELPDPRFVSSPGGYRLRNRLHLAGGRLGFYAPRSHDVADIDGCELVSTPFLARLPLLLEAFAAESGLVAEVATLEGKDGEPLLVEARAETGYADAPRLARRLLGPAAGARLLDATGRAVASAGATSLEIAAGGATFRVSVSSFFQGNRHLLDAFADEMRAALSATGLGSGDRALDLYAGVGFLTRPLLETGASVVAVEPAPSSAEDLAANLAAWQDAGLRPARAVAATAESYLARRGSPVRVVVADPPRSGLSAAVRGALRKLSPDHVLMVSCDPPTLARDVAALCSGYRVARFTLLDLFPGTHHVETLMLLSRA
jgi:23S rRNA (uracil1939-C5)-methyltransferase